MSAEIENGNITLRVNAKDIPRNRVAGHIYSSVTEQLIEHLSAMEVCQGLSFALMLIVTDCAPKGMALHSDEHKAWVRKYMDVLVERAFEGAEKYEAELRATSGVH